jgi:hypothetical protein
MIEDSRFPLHPPRPVASLRIGVTGHRPGAKLSSAIEGKIRDDVRFVIRQIVNEVQKVVGSHNWAFASANLAISTVSALAEGADSIVANVGLEEGLPLTAILPFKRDEYRADFKSHQSQSNFDAFLRDATTALELDGDRAAEDRAYEAAGLVMLSSSDLLIAIWDQRPASGAGGTAAITERAILEGIPVILIDPLGKTEPTLLWIGDSKFPTAHVRVEDVTRRTLRDMLSNVIEILIAPPSERASDALKNFYGEVERSWNFWVWFPLLLAAIGVRDLRWSDIRPLSYHNNSMSQWKSYFDALPCDTGLRQIISAVVLNSFTFADNLAIHYSQNYRGAYVFNYFAAALAVSLALTGIVGDSRISYIHSVPEGMEFLIILSILIVVSYGRKCRWHKRWMEYRRLAEWLRHFRILALTASRAPIDRPKRAPGDSDDWVSWYAFAIHKQLPLPNIAVDQNYLEKVRSSARDPELRGQMAWNHDNGANMRKTAVRLRMTGEVLFGATLVITACVFLAGSILHVRIGALGNRTYGVPTNVGCDCERDSCPGRFRDRGATLGRGRAKAFRARPNHCE